MSVDFNWDYTQPFQIDVTVEDKHIDVVGHVNNVIYLRWLEKIAWMHSHHLGLTWNVYQKENRAMVARRHELDYLAAAFKNDELVVGTWIIENNKKVSITRQYQIMRKSDQICLLRGITKWACMDIKTGKAKRMPNSFVNGYKITI